MCKDDIKSFLFNIMKKQATMFSNISLDDETDTILVTSTDGKQFIVTVNPITSDEALIEIWAKKSEIDVSCTQCAEYAGFRNIYRGRNRYVFI